ncbi:hypothetical protein KVT40_002739 [Elsinoe batatas]|uniref:Uncharacterized protein n=1 Tax=Elsinoe batatas TaxID=2601811 RepID=A0A8K0PKI3_9PEZI|nr:hypothetical protein KVT40_002739 [Elsinoe batatas]
MLLRSTLFRSRLSKGAHVATGSTAAPHLGCCFEAHRRCFSGNSPAQQQRKQKSRAAHPRPAARRSDTFEQLNELQRLREAIATIDTAQVLKNYSHLRGKTPFGPQDALDIARCLHNDVRQSTRTVSDDSLQQISTLLQMLTVDIKGGYLPPSPPAISTLLGIYRHFGLNDQAADFWSWLIRQGNEFLDQSVYAQAVDLKVDEGRPLFDIEAIFQDYLKRFPGNYLEYHLSPNAVPSQPSASLASEVPVQLLSSVTRARLQRNRTKDAYLMLDTMLRLVPEKQLNMGNFAEIVRERPLLEAFTTFHLACRYPKYTRNDLLNDVLDKMRPVGQWEPHLCLIIARATIRLLYVVLASSHSLSSGNTAKALLNVFRLVHLPGFITSPRSTKDEIADLLFVAVKTILAVLNKHGVKQNISAINHLLNAFGKQACHADATAFVLRMQAEGHVAGERTGVTSAILLQTAGNMGDRAMLRQAWSQLCEQKADALTPGDWILFAEAALKCEYLRLFDAEANRMGMDDRKTEILSHANSKMDRAAVATALAEPQSGHEMLEAAKFIHDDAISLKGLLEDGLSRILCCDERILL